MEPYIKSIRCRLKFQIPEHSNIHRSLEFTVDSGDLVYDPSEVIASIFNQISGDRSDIRRAEEVEFYSG